MKHATPDWQQVRRKFPVTENYTYLNTASSGAIATETTKAIAAFYQDQLHHAAIHRSDWLDKIRSARERVARLINASTETVGFTTDVTAAMNFVADRISSEKEVILVKGDFPSVCIPWVVRGYKIKWIEPETDHFIDFEKIIAAINDGGQVLAISWVQYSSGFAIDLGELARICRENDVRLIVDGTQGVGAMPVDVRKDQVDVLIASSFKWQGAGYGICLYYESPEASFDLPVRLTGWNSLERFHGEMTRDNLKNNAPAIEAGHAKYVSLVALDKSLQLMEDTGLNEIYKRNQDLKDLMIKSLDEVSAKFHSPVLRGHESTIICVKAGDDVYEALEARNIKTTKRDDYIRLSLHFYNSEEDIETTIKVFSEYS